MPLEQHPLLGVRYVQSVRELGAPDLVILPGTKNTVNDLLWLRQSGLEAAVLKRGCCELDGGKYEITLYTSCCNADRGIYYYTTYGNHQITAVDMHRENLDGDRLVRYPLVQGEQIALQN